MVGQKSNLSTNDSINSQVADEYTNGVKVLLHTSLGDMIIQLRNDMQITTNNFKNLVQKGTFNGTIFHRVIEGFMIQGGDPTGTGYGDPSIPEIKDEFTRKNHNDRGTIAMANAGPNSGSSQFFINLVNNNFLDPKHPAFGKVTSGMDVVDKIAKTRTDSNDRPKENIMIVNASIVP
jgi:peptidylprolyl isomerase